MIFCRNKARLLKADGKDILAVTMALNVRGDSDHTTEIR